MGVSILNLLLDTHTFLWWCVASPALSPAAVQAIERVDHVVVVNAVFVYEIVYKHARGQLPAADRFIEHGISALIADFHFQGLQVSLDHAQYAAELDRRHRDPWDRLLAAQAAYEQLSLVSNDTAFDVWPVERLW